MYLPPIVIIFFVILFLAVIDRAEEVKNAQIASALYDGDTEEAERIESLSEDDTIEEYIDEF